MASPNGQRYAATIQLTRLVPERAEMAMSIEVGLSGSRNTRHLALLFKQEIMRAIRLV